MAKGFFSIAELNNIDNGDIPSEKRVFSCSDCGLYRNCTTPKLPPSGNGLKGILVIGDSTTHLEDTKHIHGGTHYKYLKESFKKQGIDLENDCYYVNATRCYTKENIGIKALSGCNSLLLADIHRLKPKVIVTTCAMAWDVLHHRIMGGRASNISYYDWCGECIPSQELKLWIFPIFDTGIIKKEDDNQADRKYPYNRYMLSYERQIKKIVATLNETVPITNYEVGIKTTQSESEALKILDDVATWKVFAWDTETSGVKPHFDWHSIYSIGFSNGTTHYAMPYFMSKEFISKIAKIFSGYGKAIAHNGAFDYSWLKVKGGNISGTSNREDTMLMQHCMFNMKPKQLKFCVYARVGIIGYDTDVEEYLKSSHADEKIYGKNANNRIHEAPRHKVLKYNAIDCASTFDMYYAMLSEIDIEHQHRGYKFLIESEIAFSESHQHGILIDLDKTAKTKPELQEQIDYHYRAIMSSDFIIKTWCYGKFSPTSDQDVRKLIYTILKMEPTDFTDSGLPSVDVDALSMFVYACPIIPDIIALKRAYKLLNTYIAQFEREQHNGKIHTFFNLHTTKTFRSSANAPSFQNISKRDKVAKKTIRTPLHTIKGHRIIEVDVKGAEVSIASAVSGDKNLTMYASDLSKDMHTLLMQKAFWFNEGEGNKKIRGDIIKGPLTFSQFYGSSPKNSAIGVYEAMTVDNVEETYGFDLVKRCKDHGIKTFHATKFGEEPSDWEQHITSVCDFLWKDMFPDYMKFRNNAWKFFQENGYVDYVTGFRYTGVATKNEVTNAVVQGPAYHTQQWCFNYINRRMKELKMESFLIGSIHDAIIASVAEYEEEIFDCLVWDAFTKVREEWKWITVPIYVEKERSAVNGNWAEMEGCGFVKNYRD